MIRVTAALICLGAAGCVESDDAAYARGFKDGRFAGYENTCGERAILYDGDFEREAYREGLQRGNAAGIAACREEKAN